MATQWYYRIMGETVGPLSSKEMKAHAQEGRITLDTHVRRGEDGKWTLADQIKGLFSAPEKAPGQESSQPTTPRNEPSPASLLPATIGTAAVPVPTEEVIDASAVPTNEAPPEQLELHCKRCRKATAHNPYQNGLWQLLFGPSPGCLAWAITIGVVVSTGFLGICCIHFLAPVLAVFVALIGQMIYPQTAAHCALCNALNENLVMKGTIRTVQGWILAIVGALLLALMLLGMFTSQTDRPDGFTLVFAIVVVGLLPLSIGAALIFSARTIRAEADRNRG